MSTFRHSTMSMKINELECLLHDSIENTEGYRNEMRGAERTGNATPTDRIPATARMTCVSKAISDPRDWLRIA